MEVGSIAKWNVKEGDKFEVGQALCEVETDKATVTFDATEEGYIAKILVSAGEIKVGHPIMVTVEDKESAGKFASFTAPTGASAAPKTAAPTPAKTAAPVAPASPPALSAPTHKAPPSSGSRVVASPLARKLAREANVDLSTLKGTGPNGRIVAADIKIAHAGGASVKTGASLPSTGSRIGVSVPGVYQDFEISELGKAIASRYVSSKMTVPHYYLSVELNLAKLAALREDLNQGKAGK